MNHIHRSKYEPITYDPFCTGHRIFMIGLPTFMEQPPLSWLRSYLRELESIPSGYGIKLERLRKALVEL